MIINLLINFVLVLVGGLASFFPVVYLPTTFRNILMTMSSYFHTFMDSVPFMQLPYTLFLWIIGFEISLLVLKTFFGNNRPVNIN